MRGNDEQQAAVFSYVSAEQRIAAEHPLRRIRAMTDAGLRELSAEFDGLYAAGGRPSIAPERLLRALLLQVLYSRRSERLLMEEMNYNLLFRWFVGLEMDDEVWDVTVFTKNRERLIAGEVAQKFFRAVLQQARGAGLLSDEHFTVDGTLIEAWASRRSFVEKPDPPQRGTGARGRKLLRDTHQSKTDPEARLFRRSQAAESRPSYLGHAITENRNGLVVAACVTQSSTKAEREAALAMLPQISDGRRRITLGSDKGYQEREFLQRLRSRRVVPHVAEYGGKPRPWLGGLRAEERNDPGFEVSQQKRKRVEQVFGWIKHVAGLRQTKFRGRQRVELDVSTGRRSAESATPAASAAASRVVHRDSYVCPAKNSRGRQNRAVIGAGKTAHGWREREKHLIFPQAVQPCRKGANSIQAPQGKAFR